MRLLTAHLTNSLVAPIIVLLIIGCSEQEIVPINQFAPQTLDTLNAQRFEVEGLGEVLVNQGNFRETEQGIEIFGTIFTASESGIIDLSSGEFILGDEVDGVYQTLEGYGITDLPDVEFFEGFSTLVNPGSYVSYKLGSEIKLNDPEAPLQDDISYLAISPDAILESSPSFEVGDATISMGNFYIDPKDPSVYFNGEIDGAFKIENAGLGLSANGKLVFTPYDYSDELEAIMNVPLSNVEGNIYIKGEIPIPQYSIKVVGDAIVDLVLNENGPDDFFNNGLDGAEFRMGVNGSVFLDNQALDYMPGDVELELGRSTLILNTEQEGQNYVQVAGQMNTGDLAGKLLAGLDPTGFLDNVSFPGSTLEAYAYLGDDIENAQFFISNTIGVNIPGIGEQELAKALLEINSQYVFAGGRMQVPGIAQVSLAGQFFYDGAFLLEGEASFGVDFEVAKVDLVLGLVVDNDGFKVQVMAAFCTIGDSCTSISASVELNWDTGKMRVCADIPGFGNQCATI